MIQPIIQFEQYPGAAGIFEQFARAGDQVIIIQQPSIFLSRLVAAQHRFTNREKRHAGDEYAHGGAFLIKRQKAFAFTLHQITDFILPGTKFLGGKLGPNLIIGIDEDVAPLSPSCQALIVPKRKPGRKFFAMAHILRATRQQ